MEASAAVVPREIGAGRTVAGSPNNLITAYKLSKHWTGAPPDGLAPHSKHTRRPIMEKLRTGPWGDVTVRDLAQKHIRAILNGVATGHAKKHWRKSLRGLSPTRLIELREDDPSAGIKIKVATSDGYHIWTDEEIAQYHVHWPLGSEPRLRARKRRRAVARSCISGTST
jgi:hypothetical protein